MEAFPILHTDTAFATGLHGRAGRAHADRLPHRAAGRFAARPATGVVSAEATKTELLGRDGTLVDALQAWLDEQLLLQGRAGRAGRIEDGSRAG